MFAIYHSLRILVILLSILLIYPGSDRLYAKLAMSTISGALWHWLYSKTRRPATLPEFTLWLKLAMEAMAHL